ncbi:unnamed protein product [Diplocarpon coronariae]|uniref:Uncharacterized protein n=1 Tax=Diplocarpon coronariae TaxID=2795749 RepID=A0A218YYE7_9HELO|nr:hypothetical protein B2J93_545 [Marssonina coronariae]
MNMIIWVLEARGARHFIRGLLGTLATRRPQARGPEAGHVTTADTVSWTSTSTSTSTSSTSEPDLHSDPDPAAATSAHPQPLPPLGGVEAEAGRGDGLLR